MNTNRFTKYISCALAPLALACGAVGETGETLGTGSVEEPMHTKITMGHPVTGQHWMIGVMGMDIINASTTSYAFQTAGWNAEAWQKSIEGDDEETGVPRQRAWNVAFFNFGGGTTENQVKSAFTAAESGSATSNTQYTYTHVSTSASTIDIYVRPLSIGKAPSKLPSGAWDINSFYVATFYTSKTELSEPSVVPGHFFATTSGSQTSIGVDVNAINTFCNGGATCFVRVVSHVAGIALAYIGGLGSSPETFTYATSRAVDTSMAKVAIPSGQACLARSWSNTSPTQMTYTTSGQCPVLPQGY